MFSLIFDYLRNGEIVKIEVGVGVFDGVLGNFFVVGVWMFVLIKV